MLDVGEDRSELHILSHSTIMLVKGFGPMLLYQIGEHNSQILSDVNTPLPFCLKLHILDIIVALNSESCISFDNLSSEGTS